MRGASAPECRRLGFDLVAWADHRAGAERVLVGQLAVEHVADDLHVAMAVRTEARAGRDAILVDDPQRAELDVLGG